MHIRRQNASELRGIRVTSVHAMFAKYVKIHV